MAQNVLKKVVVVGDAKCGKRCLIYAFLKGKYLPTEEFQKEDQNIFNDKANVGNVGNVEVQVKNALCHVELTVFSTSDIENDKAARSRMYNAADVIILCFSIEDEDSLESIETQWLPEVRHYCRKAPIVIVGNKEDLRSNQPCLKYDSGLSLAMNIGAYSYEECSSCKLYRVQRVFETAALACIKRRKKCNIL